MRGSVNWTTLKVRTTQGKIITCKEYLARARRAEEPCEYGHIACAAWEDGPCMDEMLINIGDDQ